MTELQIVRTRHRLPDAFTTAEFREEARNQGIEDERKAIDWLIGMKQIRRVKTGHYQKTERYWGEK